MKQKKIVSMIVALVLVISAAMVITGCPQETPKPYAVLKSDDGTATLTINTFDEKTKKGTYTLEKDGKNGNGNFELVDDGTLKARITNATFAGVPQPNALIPFAGTKLTIPFIGTFDFKDILK